MQALPPSESSRWPQFGKGSPRAVIRKDRTWRWNSAGRKANTAGLRNSRPISFVFGSTGGPVKVRQVASLNRPGGNVTGVNFLVAEIIAKRMQLLREVVPSARRVALLVNPTDPENYQSTVREADSAAGGQQILVHKVATGREIDAAFADMVRERADALFVAPGSFFNIRRVQLVVLAARHALPAIYSTRAYPEV